MNILKIDRSFVSRMAVDEESLGIVETIMTLASKLKMTVVAEGIETEEQNEQLKKFGCEYGQGFFFSKPVPASDAEGLIRIHWERLASEGIVTELPWDDKLTAVDENYAM